MARVQFLDRDPTRRLACKPNGEGWEELKRHPWMSTIDWATLESKEQISPFIPDVRINERGPCIYAHDLRTLVEEGELRCIPRIGGAAIGGQPSAGEATEGAGYRQFERRDETNGRTVRHIR